MLNPRPRSVAALLAASLRCRSAASAQTYPNGQVRLIVPTSPGGVTDTMARIVAQRLSESLNQTVDRRQPAGRQRRASARRRWRARRPTG